MEYDLLGDVLTDSVTCGALINSCLMSVHTIQGQDGCNQCLVPVRQQVIPAGPRYLWDGVSGSLALEPHSGALLHLHATIRGDKLDTWRHCNNNTNYD